MEGELAALSTENANLACQHSDLLVRLEPREERITN
jgi:hypothetical protein